MSTSNFSRSPKALTAERAREAFDYDPETGALTWKVTRPGGVKAGRVAGCVVRFAAARTSYRRVGIDGVDYLAHRVCWLLWHGTWPEDEIDHIDGDGVNNRIANLRAATHAINMRNHPKHLRNKSGATGVYRQRARRKWTAEIHVDGRRLHLGQFESLDEAAYVRELAQKVYGYHPTHGLR